MYLAVCMQLTFRKTIWQLGMHCSKLDQDPMHEHSTYLKKQYYFYIKYLYAVYMHLYRNRINLSNKNYSDMAKSLDSDTGLEYRASSWPRHLLKPHANWTEVLFNMVIVIVKFSTFLSKRFSFHVQSLQLTSTPQPSNTPSIQGRQKPGKTMGTQGWLLVFCNHPNDISPLV